MASLRAPPPLPAHLRSSAAVGSLTSAHISVAAVKNNSITCSLKEKHQQQHHKSPLRTAEYLASRLGLDLAVADLERLFRDAAGGTPPSASDGEPRRPIRVAYQGGRGSYCHDAASRTFPSSIAADDSFLPCSNMEAAFTALEDRSADRAVVPAENSLDGPIARNLDLLLRHPAVNIVGELVLPVNHCLLAAESGSGSAPLRRVVSHPQALAHCAARIEALNLEIEEVNSAADAARYVAEHRIAGTAVIGSRIAAAEFGLRVVEQNLQGPGGNFTRFIQLGLGSSGNLTGRGERKTTVAFSLERGVSDLFRAMWMFESRAVRVTRVDQRPNRARPVRMGDGDVAYLDYVFVVDVEGSESNASVAAGIKGLSEFAGFVRVLGSYTSRCGGRE